MAAWAGHDGRGRAAKAAGRSAGAGATLRPLAPRDERIELEDLLRAHQQRDQLELDFLADLQERKALASSTSVDVTSQGPLRGESPARRAGRRPPPASGNSSAPAASPATMEQLWTGCCASWGSGSTAAPLLARAADHTPLPGTDARLPVEAMTACGWLHLPGARRGRDGPAHIRGFARPPPNRTHSRPWLLTKEKSSVRAGNNRWQAGQRVALAYASLREAPRSESPRRTPEKSP
ncbi:hypothetical protein [Streptomyces sp. A0592]|uniref:hypothetical protein n=1 Tax=Streptomyces sp. A0592 TaxID=2563099 RepID=UPI00109E4511|nr:hypothetical protein [Streptomyces sp. A0592]THA80299.1 hypothetical protein E6U81_29460 [Streptomyces sp. A0592]